MTTAPEPAPEPTDIWDKTHRCDYVPGARHVRLRSVISGCLTGPHQLVARIEIESYSAANGVDATVNISLTPKQMRDLATLLHQHADRIETTLIPLLHPAPALIEFELPPGLYREPEAA